MKKRKKLNFGDKVKFIGYSAGAETCSLGDHWYTVDHNNNYLGPDIISLLTLDDLEAFQIHRNQVIAVKRKVKKKPLEKLGYIIISDLDSESISRSVSNIYINKNHLPYGNSRYKIYGRKIE